MPDDKFEVQSDPAQILVSQQVPCLGETEYGGKGQSDTVTWPSISRDAGQATAQGNHHWSTSVNEKISSTL